MGDRLRGESAQIVKAIENGAWTIDLLVYPAVFNYRHGAELYLKHLTILANRLLQTGATMQQGHSILHNWRTLGALFTQLNDPYFKAVDIDVVGRVLTDLAAVDPTGQVFRYPEDNKGNQHLEDIGIISVEVLADGMDILLEVFQSWNSGLFALLERKQLNTNSI